MIAQREYWNGPSGERWVREQALLDVMLRPFGEAALQAAKVGRGDIVLDVGCGCGDTTLALADLVGPAGRVLGVDLSEPMLARARERSQGRPNLSFLKADAGQADLAPGSFDVLFSRFGVMFFSQPVESFVHLRAALRPGARLAFAAWGPLAENPWARVPFEAAAGVVGRPEPDPPGAPGPFALADASHLSSILTGAGFTDVVPSRLDTTMTFGIAGTVADAAREAARLGPAARLLTDKTEADVARAVSAIEGAIAPFAGSDGGVRFPAAAWIVSARSR